MPRRDCGPHRVEWHTRSCFCRMAHHTCVSLYGVTLSSRSTTLVAPYVTRTHRNDPRTLRSPFYEICVAPKRWGLSARRRRASPRTY
ncbi:hypothetical protein TNCT_76131 [Trichonephila clavata]|uniref:Uncharacterized protein n=1 Tax=Trichonephila clavata TaxID=2740835 RepID=A0A8X6J4S6_TRICU|nr:hypothetical protein TNCT_76131 [Trichonephila clavata]